MSGEERTPLYPVSLDLAGRLCVVVGDGPAAERKARALVACGADVVVVTSRPSEDLLVLGVDGALSVEQRGYVRGDLDHAFMAVCTGCSDEIARAIHAEAEERGCLVSVTGMPELTNFIVPSVLDRGHLQIAVSTGGASPEVARQARARIADALGEEWGAYASLAAEVRALAFERVEDDTDRAEILGRLADAGLPERIAAGEALTADAVLAELRAVGVAPDADAQAEGAGERSGADTGAGETV